MIGGGPFILGFFIVLTLGFCLMWAGFPLMLIILTILILVFIVIPLYTDFMNTIKKSYKNFKIKQAKIEGKLITINTTTTTTKTSGKSGSKKAKPLTKQERDRIKAQERDRKKAQQRKLEQDRMNAQKQSSLMKRQTCLVIQSRSGKVMRSQVFASLTVSTLTVNS